MDERIGPRGEQISITIPVDLLELFEKEVRLVIRHPWIIGIPVPEVLFRDPDTLAKFQVGNS